MSTADYAPIGPEMPRLEAQRGGIVLLASVSRLVSPLAWGLVDADADSRGVARSAGTMLLSKRCNAGGATTMGLSMASTRGSGLLGADGETGFGAGTKPLGAIVVAILATHVMRGVEPNSLPDGRGLR